MIVLNRPRPPVGATFINRRSRQLVGLVFAIPPTLNAGNICGSTTYPHYELFGRRGKDASEVLSNFWVIDKDFGPVWRESDVARHINFGLCNNITAGLTKLTLSAWVNFVSTVSGHILTKQQGGVGSDWQWVFSTTTNLQWRLWTSTGNTTHNMTLPAIPAGQWNHFVAVYDGAQMQQYMNGRPLVALSARTGTTSDAGGLTVPLTMYNNNVLGQKLIGSIHDPRIYNRALGPGEIWEMYDPRTRWELYSPSGLYVPQLAGGGVVTRSYGYIF